MPEQLTTLILCEAVSLQPNLSVTVKIYCPASGIEALGITGFNILAVKLLGPVHKNEGGDVDELVALRFILAPIQTVVDGPVLASGPAPTKIQAVAESVPLMFVIVSLTGKQFPIVKLLLI
jgi:hypothetical protein